MPTLALTVTLTRPKVCRNVQLCMQRQLALLRGRPPTLFRGPGKPVQPCHGSRRFVVCSLARMLSGTLEQDWNPTLALIVSLTAVELYFS